MFKPADLFDLSQTAHAKIFDGCEFAWDALKKIQDYIAQQPKQIRRKDFPARPSAKKFSSAKERLSNPAR